MRDFFIRFMRKTAGVLAASGLLANFAVVTLGLAVSTVAVTSAWANSPASYAQCSTTTAMGSVTITYTSGTLGTAMSGTSGNGVTTCTSVASSPAGYGNTCFYTTWGSVTNSTNNSSTIPISSTKLAGTVLVDNLFTNQLNSNTPFSIPSGNYTWQLGTSNAPVGISQTAGNYVNGQINSLASTFSIATGSTSSTTPSGTYTATIPIYSIMGPPNGATYTATCTYMQSNFTLAAQDNVTLNVVIPQVCSVSVTSGVAFGSVSAAAVVAGSATANGAVATTCNSTTPYTIYLGDGNNRVSAGSGLRQMATGTKRLAYQLYKDSAHTQVWDATGGTSATGGSGGVTINTTGTISTPIYGQIAPSATLAVGTYTDSVVVTLTY